MEGPDKLPAGSEEGPATKEKPPLLDATNLIRFSRAANWRDDVCLKSFDGKLDLLGKDKHGNTLLHWASRLGHLHVVSEILEACPAPSPGSGADGRGETFPINPRPPSGEGLIRDDLLHMTNENGDTAAHEAIRHSHVDVAMKLLDKDPTLSTVINSKLESLLYLAAKKGLDEVVKHLLDVQPEAAAGGLKGRTALHAAVMSGSTSIVKLLLDKRPQLNQKESDLGDIPLHLVAYLSGDEKMASLMLMDHSTVYHPNKDGNTPIHMAAMAGNLPMMRVLVKACPEAGVLVNNQGWNVLHVAVQHERSNIVEYILHEHWLDRLVNQRDKDGNSPLHLAALHWNLPILRELLNDAEVDKLARNFLDQSALDVFLEKVESEPTTQWFEAQLLLRRAIPYLPKTVENAKYKEGEQGELNMNLKLKRKAKEVIQANVEQDREKILTVSTLIAALTFAAAFTVPGGYIGNNNPKEGLPILLRVTSFKIFIVLTVLTICSSLAAIFLCIFASWDDTDYMIPYREAIRILMIFSFYGMTTSFAVGMYTILAPEARWLAVFVCAMCCSFPLVTFVWAKWRVLKLLMQQLRRRMIERSNSSGRRMLPKFNTKLYVSNDLMTDAGSMSGTFIVYKTVDELKQSIRDLHLRRRAERDATSDLSTGHAPNVLMFEEADHSSHVVHVGGLQDPLLTKS